MTERCAWSDLPKDQCAHCQGLTGFVTDIGTLEKHVGHPLPQFRAHPREWHVPIPEKADCDHRQEDLCGDCAQLLDDLCADLPEMVAQLTTTLRKGHRFAPHGFRRGDIETPDEAPIPWSQPAMDCLTDLRRFQTSPPDNRHTQLHDLSRLALRAHRIIDRPPDREVTMCPKCRGEIIVTNRSLAVTCGATIVEDDPDAPEPAEGEPRKQRTRLCTYAADWKQHRRDLIGVNLDAQLTMNELLIVLADEDVNRDKINNMVRRHGLPREQHQTGEWRGGQIDVRTIWTYRLGDVLFMLAQINDRKAAS